MLPPEDDKPWDDEARQRLLKDLKESWPADEEDFLKQILWDSPEEVTDLDGPAYDAAFNRVVRSLRRSRKRFEKDEERRQRSLKAFRGGVKESLALPLSCHGWPMAEAYLELSFEARYSDPRAMLTYAKHAAQVAKKTPLEVHPPGVVFDLRARANAELANAHRVNQAHPAAEAALDQAKAWLEQGSGDLGLLARTLVVEANLRSDQLLFWHARVLLERAHDLYQEIGERHLAGRTLVSKAYVLYRAGDPVEAISTLERGKALLDPERDPQLIKTSHQTLILYLAECGEYSRAGEELLKSGLREAFAEEPLNLQRLRWVEGKIHAGMNRLDLAEGIFREVRAGFQELAMEYDAALVGLDLAALWLRQGKREKMRPLVAEMSETFVRLNLAWEPILAMGTLELACQNNLDTVRMVETVRDFLTRYRDDPGLRFDARSVILNGG